MSKNLKSNASQKVVTTSSEGQSSGEQQVMVTYIPSTCPFWSSLPISLSSQLPVLSFPLIPPLDWFDPLCFWPCLFPPFFSQFITFQCVLSLHPVSHLPLPHLLPLICS